MVMLGVQQRQSGLVCGSGYEPSTGGTLPGDVLGTLFSPLSGLASTLPPLHLRKSFLDCTFVGRKCLIQLPLCGFWCKLCKVFCCQENRFIWMIGYLEIL